MTSHVCNQDVCKANVYNLGRLLCHKLAKKLVFGLPEKKLFGLASDSDGENPVAEFRMVPWYVVNLVVSKHEQ